MTAVTLVDESREQRGFYSPHFTVAVEDQELTREVLGDVIRVTYHDSIKELDGFELEVGNWNPETRTYPYIGSETAETLKSGAESRMYRLFEPGSTRVELAMGYLDRLRVMLTGTITAMEPKFGGSGATLTVRGLNALHKLRSRPYTTEWFDKKDSEIASNIATLTDRETGGRRFPLSIEVSRTARSTEPQLDYVAQQNQHDIDFLYARARERGYVILIQERDPEVRGSRQRLYFGPPSEQVPGFRPVTYRLEWGKSLLEFNPTLATSHQVESVTVMGWDRRTHARIREKVSLSDARFDTNRDLFRLLRADGRQEVVSREPVRTAHEARERAYAILLDRVRNLVTVSASTVGLPDLRAGQLVEIGGVGSRLSGTYFVTGTTHKIDDQGYTTKFEARREQIGGAA
jgi:uncharacterized protein